MTYEDFIKKLAELVDGEVETAERIAKRANVIRKLKKRNGRPIRHLL